MTYSFYSKAGKLLLRETPQGTTNYIFLGNKLIAKDKDYAESEQVSGSSRVRHEAYAYNNPYKYTDPTGEIPLVVVAIWILKEAGDEAFERTTGIPAPTVKNIAKYGMNKAMKQSIKNRKKIEGVYRFKEGDKEYIDQSKDVIKQHAGNKGKFAKKIKQVRSTLKRLKAVN